jgi:hypothetical protein
MCGACAGTDEADFVTVITAECGEYTVEDVRDCDHALAEDPENEATLIICIMGGGCMIDVGEALCADA